MQQCTGAQNFQLRPVQSVRAKALWFRALRLVIEEELFPRAYEFGHSPFYAFKLRVLRRHIIHDISGSPVYSAPSSMPAPLSPSLSPIVAMAEDVEDGNSPSPSAIWTAYTECPGCGPGGSQLICQTSAGRSCYEATQRHERQQDSMEDLLDELE